jgi:hypothetical protein
MLFDILSTIEITASAALVVAILSFAFATTSRGRVLLAALSAAWFLIVIILGATLALDRQGVGAIGFPLAVILPIATICFAFFAIPSIRAALFAMPLPVLVAAKIARALGVSFLLLYAADKLPAPFALSAGWGDIFVGVTAAPLAWLAWRYGAQARGLIFAWNIIGVADLVNAIVLGAISRPGPIQIFAGPPDSALMTTLPWILIPCFLVPSYLSLHVAIFYRLSRMSRSAPASRDQSPSANRPSIENPGPPFRPLSLFKTLYRIFDYGSA